MKKTKLYPFILFALFLVVSMGNTIIHSEEIEGSWTAKIVNDKVKMRLTIFENEESWGRWSSSGYFEKNEFTDLQLNTDHTFKLSREAGNIVCEAVRT